MPVTTYGIWNEPAIDTFWRGPGASPARYVRPRIPIEISEVGPHTGIPEA